MLYVTGGIVLKLNTTDCEAVPGGKGVTIFRTILQSKSTGSTGPAHLELEMAKLGLTEKIHVSQLTS